MKTIRQKIFTPYISTIIIMAVVILLVFQFAMRLYSQRLAKEEMENTLAGMETLISSQIDSGNTPMTGNEDISLHLGERLTLLRNALRITEFLDYTDFVIVGPSGQVVFPKSYENSFLNGAIVSQAIQRLDSGSGDFLRFQVGSSSFLTTEREISTRFANLRLVLISYAKVDRGINRFVSVILLVIVGLAGSIAALAAYRVSRGISEPISKLAVQAKQIGNGSFPLLPDETSSKELYDLNQSINSMAQRLEKYHQTQNLYLQNASHELRTSLMSIGGYAEGMAKGIFTDIKKTAEIICGESQRLNVMVNKLLTLSRMESGSQDIRPVNLNLCNFMKDFMQRVGGLALQENKKLNLECGTETIPVRLDEEILTQAVLNVVSNGIKHAKSIVKVSVSLKDGKASIRIADDGYGIADKDLPHIFERFYKGKGGGSGLGLAIAQSAVGLMDGSISVHNDHGAVFEIVLPLDAR